MIRPVTRRGLQLIKAFEGRGDGDPSTVNLDPYMDVAGYWTVGWGHLIRAAGRKLRGAKDRATAIALYPMGLTHEQADILLAADVLDTCTAVDALAPNVLDAEYDALVSFAFNVGPAALARSTLLRLLKAGDHAGAQRQFVRWNQADGKVIAGLTRRRKAEAQVFAGSWWSYGRSAARGRKRRKT